MELTTAITLREGSTRMVNLETRCNQLELLLQIRDEQIRSMDQHFSQLPSVSSQTNRADLKDEIEMLRSQWAKFRLILLINLYPHYLSSEMNHTQIYAIERIC